MKENSSLNNEKDNVSLVLRKVQAQKCFSKSFLDVLPLINCEISFQRKHPVMLGQILPRLVRNDGLTWSTLKDELTSLI